MGEVGCLKDGNFQNLQVEGPIQIKTASSAILPAPAGTGASAIKLTAEQSGQTLLCNLSAASASLVLPTATVGLNYTIVLDRAAPVLGDSGKIWAGPNYDSVTQAFWGTITVQKIGGTTSGIDVGTQTEDKPCAGTFRAICLANNSSLTGGVAGDRLFIKCVNAGVWHVDGYLHTSVAVGAAVAPMDVDGTIAA